MNHRHFVIGAGPVGTHVAARLAHMGAQVTVATRSGSHTGIDGVTHTRVDAADPEALTCAARGADVIYNCANPGDYTSWQRVWPPLASSILQAAVRNEAVLAITGNLYPYGPVTVPMTEELPDAAPDAKGVLRGRMWADALAAHRSGDVRAVEVRGSDYLGPGIGANGHVSRQLNAMARGKRLWVMGSADQPHSWTDVGDMAAALIAAAADEDAHGQIWFAPTNRPRSQREALHDVAEAAGFAEPRVAGIPSSALAVSAWFSPMARELRALEYQWTRPYIMDDSRSRSQLGLEPTPWDEVCRRTAGG